MTAHPTPPGAETPGLFALLAERQVGAPERPQGALRPWLPYAFDRIARESDDEQVDETQPPAAADGPRTLVEHVRPPHEDSVTKAPEPVAAASPAAKPLSETRERVEPAPRPRPHDESVRSGAPLAGREPARVTPAPPRPDTTPADVEARVRHLHTHQHVSRSETLASPRVAHTPASETARIRPLPPAPPPAPFVVNRRDPALSAVGSDRAHPQETTIEIHIGRLEVRAQMDAHATRETPRRPPTDDRLAAYLQRRAAGARS